MRVPLRWLSEYVSFDWTPERLAERLTMAGLEVGAIERIGDSWDGVTTSLVTAVQPHPNADRLRLVTVESGDDTITVVCGAPNVAVGQKVAFARVGACLLDGHTGKLSTLKPAKIRGVVSEGMVCSEKELGLSDNHEGILVLPPDAPLGIPLSEYAGDVIFDLELTPNRADCMSIIGVAHEVAALTGGQLRIPEIAYKCDDTPMESLMEYTIEDSHACARYCATVVRNIHLGPSPDWMQSRLRACGMRPISNVVDITNYVMLEYGQPLHAFDYDAVAGHKIVVRRASEGEIFTTLDDVERKMSSDVLMIADGDRTVGIAGIMGGSNTEISETTTSILLEAATFNRGVIRKGSEYLGLRTEASIRFDKGLHPDLAPEAVRRATQLLVELCGGVAAGAMHDTYLEPVSPNVVFLPANEVRRLSGMDVSAAKVQSILQSLGYCLKESTAEGSSYSVPYWRVDVSCAADLVEEAIRIIGYDSIPAGVPRFSAGTVSVPADMWEFKGSLRNVMVGAGFQEVVTYSLTSLESLGALVPSHASAVEPMKVANPMSRELEFLRTSLRASVLEVVGRNRRREQLPVRVFELGRVYIPRGSELPDERETLCALLSGTEETMSWLHGERRTDFYDAKGVADLILAKTGVVARYQPSSDAGLFPGRQAEIIVEGMRIGVVGQLHPTVAGSFGVEADTFVVEFDAGLLIGQSQMRPDYHPLSRYPFSERDVAIVVDKSVEFESVADIIRGFSLVAKAALFDLYEGEQVPEGKKSFAIRLTYQATDRTLTDAEVNGVQKKLLAKLESGVGATLRG
ncbi:MAG: phenylalanine--tRNA ligase subunit beta [Dehalococcoidia bacterium]|nr:phenylalanine--tRNA ligase subunit beta [Dehalococcoidia bacterium]